MGRQLPRSGPIELDGRTLEGGGQLLRNALCLSALTGTPIQITNIRGKRGGGGGLKAQHVACVRWLSQACGAGLDDVEKGTKNIVFHAGKLNRPDQLEDTISPVFRKVSKEGEVFYACNLSIGTAGSLGLALQAVLPFILFSRFPSDLPVRLTMSGGTNVSGSPSYDYVKQVLLPTLHGIGFPLITSKLSHRGWSQGRASMGEFTLEIPSRVETVLPAFKWRPEDLKKNKPVLHHLRATVISPASMFEPFRRFIVSEVEKVFREKYHLISPESQPLDDILTVECEDSKHGKGIYLLLVATLTSTSPSSSSNLCPSSLSLAQQPRSTDHPPTSPTSFTSSPPFYYLARDWLYERKHRDTTKVAEETSARVTRELAEEIRSGGWVDEHMRDQLVIFQALAKGRNEVWAGVEVEDDESGSGKGKGRGKAQRDGGLEDSFSEEDSDDDEDEDEEDEEDALGMRLKEPSLHARTAEWVAKEVLGVRFTVEGACEGIGFDERESKDQKR